MKKKIHELEECSKDKTMFWEKLKGVRDKRKEENLPEPEEI